ncbi:MAG: dGTPase, partial [Solirubrobacteraceae bacterium]|nr:dGTPase [Solirubrobacteraceae bacterium]
ILRALFDHYVANPPPGLQDASPAERVIDWLAGMTDGFCIREFEALSVPRSFAP